MKPFNLTFRLKILFSLTGTVIIFLGVLLVVVRNEISNQERRVTEQTKERSHLAFNELERLYHEELLRFGRRISTNNRFPAMLQEAVEEDDPQALIDSAAYELNLAKIDLAIFKDETGEPVLTLLDGKVPEQPRPRAGEADGAGYYVVNGQLFTTHGIKLHLFGEPVGSVAIGFPADDTLARRMGKVIQAEVAFLVKGEFLASSSLESIPGLKEQMKAAAAAEEPVPVLLNGNHWIIISEPLFPDTSRDGRRVLAVSLEEYLAPLYHIETVFRLAGLLILLISILLGISISRGLAAPVQRLVRATQRVAGGDYRSRVPVRGRDELSILGESFNRMTDGLLLKEQYRGILDKVVSPEVAEEMVKGNITLGGENRRVTILFADVRGFTAMTEGMEPQEVIAMLNQYMEHAGAAVEMAGGVVDKYVGDQIMAIFGAPVSRPDDPLRAVGAALKMMENLDTLNEERRAVNKPEIKIGIGINTGLAVAGNMGSEKRLNYTVLGESVNVAARLCSQAAPSEILISGNTYKKVAVDIDVKDHETLPMKGISKPLEVFKVKRLKKKSLKRLNGLFIFILLFICSGLWAEPAPAWSLVSRDGRFQVDIGGRLELSGYLPGDAPAYMIEETDPFVSGRLSLFTDIFLGKRLYGLVELRADRGEIPGDGPLKVRLQQAFLRYTFLSSFNLHVQVGKFVSPFGEYSQRHDTVADPFIRPPLLHEYRTMICPGFAPKSNNSFIRWKYDPDRFRPIGAPVIWGIPYQAGAMVFGGFGRFTFRAAAMNSAPSSTPGQWDLDLGQEWDYSVVIHVGYHFSPELTVGLSFNRGPYSTVAINNTLPEGRDINDYPQILWGFDVTYTRGKLAVRGEFVYDTWEVPRVKDISRDFSYYLEVSYKFLPGFYGALRYNAIHFNRLSYDSGEKDGWDYFVQRLQVGVGYRFSPRLDVRMEYMWNRTRGPEEPRDNLLALQWRLRL